MAENQRIGISEIGEVTVAQFVDRKILDASLIQNLGEELFALVDSDQCERLLLNFSNVEFLSSAALNKLIMLDKKVKAKGGQIKFSDLRPEIREVFVITRLTQLFDIQDTQTDALASFS